MMMCTLWRGLKLDTTTHHFIRRGDVFERPTCYWLSVTCYCFNYVYQLILCCSACLCGNKVFTFWLLMHDVVEVLQVVPNMDGRKVIVPITMQWNALSVPSLEKEVQQRWSWHILPVDKATTKDVSIEGRVGQVEQSFLQLVVSGPEGIWDSPLVVMEGGIQRSWNSVIFLTLLTDMDQVHHYHITFHNHPTQQRILIKLHKHLITWTILHTDGWISPCPCTEPTVCVLC